MVIVEESQNPVTSHLPRLAPSFAFGWSGHQRLLVVFRHPIKKCSEINGG